MRTEKMIIGFLLVAFGFATIMAIGEKIGRERDAVAMKNSLKFHESALLTQKQLFKKYEESRPRWIKIKSCEENQQEQCECTVYFQLMKNGKEIDREFVRKEDSCETKELSKK